MPERKVAARKSAKTMSISSPSAETVRFPLLPIDHKEALNMANNLDTELQRVQKGVAKKIDEWLTSLEGQKLDEQSDEIVKAIARLIRRAGRQLLYNGEPVTLQCVFGTRQRTPSIQVRRHHRAHTKVVFNSVRFPPLTTKPLS